MVSAFASLSTHSSRSGGHSSGFVRASCCSATTAGAFALSLSIGSVQAKSAGPRRCCRRGRRKRERHHISQGRHDDQKCRRQWQQQQRQQQQRQHDNHDPEEQHDDLAVRPDVQALHAGDVAQSRRSPTSVERKFSTGCISSGRRSSIEGCWPTCIAKDGSSINSSGFVRASRCSATTVSAFASSLSVGSDGSGLARVGKSAGKDASPNVGIAGNGWRCGCVSTGIGIVYRYRHRWTRGGPQRRQRARPSRNLGR